jgi:hypothetical protein
VITSHVARVRRRWRQNRKTPNRSIMEQPNPLKKQQDTRTGKPQSPRDQASKRCRVRAPRPRLAGVSSAVAESSEPIGVPRYASLMPTDQILALLLAERDNLNRAIEALSGPTKRRGRPPKNPLAVAAAAPPKKRGRTFSPAHEESRRRKNAPALGGEEEGASQIAIEGGRQPQEERPSSVAAREIPRAPGRSDGVALRSLTLLVESHHDLNDVTRGHLRPPSGPRTANAAGGRPASTPEIQTAPPGSAGEHVA